MENTYIGVDIGGTNTVIGLFDESLSLLAKHSVPTIKSQNYCDYLAAKIHRLLRESGREGSLAGAGMGVPGLVDPGRGIAIGSLNLAWNNVPFADEMENRLGVPVRIDNDVRAYTLGEALKGAGRGCRDLICVTIGTGIAAGIMCGGKLICGGGWSSGEIGHDTVAGGAYACKCGKTGCLETIASATGIARLAEDAVKSGRKTSLSRLDRLITSLDVYHACLEDDGVAREIFEYAGTVLGEKLVSALYLLNPAMVIVGGGAAAAGEYLLQPIRRVIDEQYRMPNKPVVAKGRLGDSAGLIGAVHYAAGRISDV